MSHATRRCALGYWQKYTTYALAGLPVALGLEFGLPPVLADLSDSVPGWLSALAVPTPVLVFFACASRFADAGSTAIGLRVHRLYEGAPGLGRSPDYAVLYRVALSQSVLLGVGTAALVHLADAAALARVGVLLVLYMSACATVQNLLLAVGISRLRVPRPPSRSREDQVGYEWLGEYRPDPHFEHVLYGVQVQSYNLSSQLIQFTAVGAALIASAAILSGALRFERTRFLLLIVILCIAMWGVDAGTTKRREDEVRREREALEASRQEAQRLLLALVAEDRHPNREELVALRQTFGRLPQAEVATLISDALSRRTRRGLPPAWLEDVLREP